MSFSKKILAWSDQHGRHDLPWQQDKTPYRVWVSEIMLQQTQVKTVIPYYLRFMQRFPNVFELAKSSSDEVLHHWTGLGYYSRARNLHKTAKKIVSDFAGIFPKNLNEMQSLPGIGRSTAGAILSIAYNIPIAILDGNVKRVLSRFFGVEDVITDKKVEKKLWDYATESLPKNRAADYTQAMMDLGATVCIRSKPLCSHCPLQDNCFAYKNNLTNIIPKKRTTKSIPIKTKTFVIIKLNDTIFLQKRNADGIWGGLFSFPEISGTPDPAEIVEYCFAKFHLSSIKYKNLSPFRHTFSHFHLDIFPILINLNQQPLKIMEHDEVIWYNLKQPPTIGLPKPIVKIVEELANDTTTLNLLQ